MPPITVLAVEPDPAGGFLVHWRDEANLDGLPLEGFCHLTAESLDELCETQRRPNRAPEQRIEQVRARLSTHAAAKSNAARASAVLAVGDAFASAYGEIIDDIKDRHRFGMKAVTSHGHEDLEAVRAGEPVRPWNRRDDTGPMTEFIRRRNQEEPHGNRPADLPPRKP